MTADELVALNEQIAGMAKAGLPLDRGLAGLAKEMGYGRLRRRCMHPEGKDHFGRNSCNNAPQQVRGQRGHYG